MNSNRVYNHHKLYNKNNIGVHNYHNVQIISKNNHEKTGKKKTPRGSNNKPRKTNSSIKHDCIEAERKIAFLQEEVARLEDIIIEQKKKTIKIHKIRAASAYCNNHEPVNNNSGIVQANINERMRDIEIEKHQHLRNRIAMIEMESRLKNHTDLSRSQRPDNQIDRDINLNRKEDLERPLRTYTVTKTHIFSGCSVDSLTTPPPFTQHRTGIIQNDNDIYTSKEDQRKPMWNELQPRIINPQKYCSTHTEQEDPRRSKGIISDIREQIESGHSWNSLAMSASVQPGKMIRWNDRNINTPQDSMRTPQMTYRDNREQVEAGHSWDSLAMSASDQPGKVIRWKDRDINTPDSPATSVIQRDNLAMPASNQPGKVNIWKDRYTNKLDSLAMSVNPQPVGVDEEREKEVCPTTEGIGRLAMTYRNFKEQVETGHSWDSLAMPPKSQPVTVNRVDQQPQEHIHKTCIGNATQTIQITNQITPIIFVERPSFHRNITHKELANNPTNTEIPTSSNRTAEGNKQTLHSKQNVSPRNKPDIILSRDPPIPQKVTDPDSTESRSQDNNTAIDTIQNKEEEMLTITTLNVHGFRSNKICLAKLQEKTDILCIPEHLLYTFEKEEITDFTHSHAVHPKACDHQENVSPKERSRGHGGVAILWLNDLDRYVKTEDDGNNRIVCIQLLLDSQRILIVNVYMPCRNTQTGDNFEETLDQLRELMSKCRATHHVIICGDINASLHRLPPNAQDLKFNAFCKEENITFNEEPHPEHSFDQHNGLHSE